MDQDRLSRAEPIFHAAVDLSPVERASLLSERCGDDVALRALVENLLARHDDGVDGFLETRARTVPDGEEDRHRFARLREVLVRATGLPESERAAYLESACGDDRELFREAEAILAHDGGVPMLASDETDSPEERSRRPTSRIGPYRIRERLGEGGFGEVFSADQSRPVRRRVAVKILKAGMDTREVLARFEAERQALAMMDHPNVCRVFDAGETPHGRSYFVMELLHGEPITAYCDRHLLTTEERLALFLPVCHAIRHAHRKGVVHRDVKPSNVLITIVDGEPVPKVIDFGIAKATAQPLTEFSLHTMWGQVIGTPAYMSPEQADPSGMEVDERTDVYSLGVLLYELLTGCLPFETESLQAAGLDGMRRIIREEEPPKPSTRVGTLGTEAKAAAAKRQTDPSHWRRALHGELDWIVMKALEKKRERRYGTADDLARDIERYLHDRPVAAGPPGAVYRTRKFVWRHRVGVAFTATVLLAVAVGIGAGAWLWQRSRHLEDALPKSQPTRVTDTETWEGKPALSPGGERVAYVSDASGNLDIYVADVEGGEPLQVTHDPGEDRHPFWFPDGESIGFTSGRDGAPGIWKVDRRGGTPTRLVANARHGTVSPDGARIAAQVHSEPGVTGIALFDLANPEEEFLLTQSDGGFWIHDTPVWSPDGRSICYADLESLWIVPSGGGTPSPLLADPWFDSQPVWSSSGRHIYFSSLRDGTEAIWRVAVSTGELERVTMGTGPESWPSLSADGTRLAYGTGAEDGDVVLLDRRRRSTTRLVGVGQVLSLARAADRVLYVRAGPGGRADLWELPLTDGRPAPPAHRLTDHPGISTGPDLSPDGRWIAYYRVVEGRRSVHVIPAEGGSPRPVDERDASSLLPVWSPDGTRLAYVSDWGGVQRIWIVDIRDGRPAGSPRLLAPEGVFSADWSPDGGQIAYVGRSTEATEVFVIPVDGEEPRQVTTNADAQSVRWDTATGRLLVSGAWGEDRFRLRSVAPDGGEVLPFEPEVEFGALDAPALFDVDAIGAYLIYVRSDLRGDIWVLEAEEGSY